MKKILLITALTLILTSCFSEEVPLTPPKYEEITITSKEIVSSSFSSGARDSSAQSLIKFELQDNKFVIDKDLDNFSSNYGIKLLSKFKGDNSYVGIKISSIYSLVMEDKPDLERELQTKIQYNKKPVDIGECLIESEGTEKGPGYIYVKDCGGRKYLVQLINDVYESSSGSRMVGHKAYPFDTEVKKFFIQEYFNGMNKIDSFDIDFIDPKNVKGLKYAYEESSTSPIMNGNISYTDSNKEKKVILTKRNVVVKEDIIAIYDTLIDDIGNFDQNFEILKSFKIESKLDIGTLPNKFADTDIFENFESKYNKFLLFRKDYEKKKYIEFIPRFPDTLYVKAWIGKSKPEVKKEMENFEKNFGYKKGYEAVRDYPKFIVYSYSGDKKRYSLIVGKDEKNNKEYAGKYIYIEADKNFLIGNMKTYNSLIGQIKE